jgi:hypothetical protein
MSDSTKKEVKLTTNVNAIDFTKKIEPGTLIMAIQKDLIRVNDFAITQERPTTYVLSDFNIQLKAVVTQDADKTMIILPSRPGELDPNLLSLVNITLKPIPLTAKPSTESRPVETIEGIGLATAERLRNIGIKTLKDLAHASSQNLINIGIPKVKAEQFISMAKLMMKSNISGVYGIDEQAAELLVAAAKIDSKEELARSDPEQLHKVLTEAIKTKKVKVPSKYSLTVEDIKAWVASAEAITREANF